MLCCITFGYAQKHCPKMKDLEGHKYPTVRIGEQCWMAANMRTVFKSDGVSIVCGWFEASQNPRLYFPNNELICDEDFGYLYNWHAAMQVCPKGWHLPSDSEWSQLTDFVSSHPEFCCGSPGSNSKALSATKAWAECTVPCAVGNDLSRNNATGFNAFPAGGFYGESYGYFGKGTFFWSSTESPDGKAYKRYIDYDKDRMVRDQYFQYGAGAVRCIHD